MDVLLCVGMSMLFSVLAFDRDGDTESKSHVFLRFVQRTSVVTETCCII